ncbi:AI-2E family transporter [Halosolutus amylolyticus]|uniref:AI-2E family transporter n=1 Tax=Halosolutus amylolyticus TaxID=2932267 RepID=A0ABD5PM86_9EURY|nr:AI-2E family transporter [Halosolutus amylolyticus]
MADDADSSDWFADGAGLTALALVSVALATLIVLPYLQYILLGVVLAYILVPAQRRLETVVSPAIAALALVAVAILAILLPTMYVLAIALQQALEVVTAIQEGTLDVGDIERQLESSGLTVDLAEMYGTYQEPIGTALQGVASTGIEFVGGLPGILIGLTVTLFVLFALLRDGERLVAWMRRVVPIEDDVQRELIGELDQLMWASLVGNVAVAAIQAVLLATGLWLLGVPAVAFLGVVTFVLTLLPLVGAFGVWVPVVLYLVAIGDVISAAILVAYGSLVSASDTYLRPALIGKTGAFNSAIIVVGIFGGIVVFGAVGLFVGPVVLGGAKVTLDLFARERSTRQGEPSVPEGEASPDVDAAVATDAVDDAAVDTEPDTGIRPGMEDDADRAPDSEPDDDRSAPEAEAKTDAEDGGPEESADSDE